jgi:hypothetical protein
MSAFNLSWKNFLLVNPDSKISNKHLEKIKELVGSTVTFKSAFKEISKNQGIAFISFDPSDQLFNSFTITRSLLEIRTILLCPL